MHIKLFEMGICLPLSQADSSEYALGHIPEHFHEVEEAGLSHWAAQAPQLFQINRQWRGAPRVAGKIHY